MQEPGPGGAAGGLFVSQIPEEVRETLLNYLVYARFNDAEGATSSPSFIAVIERFDEHIGVLFIKAWMHLVENAYVAALEGDSSGLGSWGVESPTTLSNEDIVSQMQERLEFLSSVGNDLHRIDSMTVVRAAGSGAHKQQQQQLAKLFENEAVVGASAAASTRIRFLQGRVGSSMASALLRILCTESVWTDPAAHKTWLPEGDNGSNNPDNAEEALSFTCQMRDLGDLLESTMSYCHSYLTFRLLSNVVFRVVGRYLLMLRQAAESNRCIGRNSLALRALVEAVQTVRDTFTELTRGHHDSSLTDFADSILAPVRCLDQAVALVTYDLDSEEFEKTLQSVLKVAGGHPRHAIALARFVECCMSLRHDKGSSAAATTSQASPGSQSGVASDSTAASGAAPMGVNKRRTSVFGSMLSSVAQAAGMAAQGTLTPGTPGTPASSLAHSHSSHSLISSPLTSIYDPRVIKYLEDIRDCYDEDDDMDRALLQDGGVSSPSGGGGGGDAYQQQSPIAAVFAEASSSSFHVANFLYGARKPEKTSAGTTLGSTGKSIVGSMLSLIGGTSSPQSSTASPLLMSPLSPHHAASSPNLRTSHRVRLTGLRCNSLLCLAGKPRAFLSLTLEGITTKTEVHDGSNPLPWEGPFELPLLSSPSTMGLDLDLHHGDSTSARMNNTNKLTVVLYYMGKYYGDEAVAQLTISLGALTLAEMRDETFVFDVWKSPKAKAAADRATLLGAELPSLTLSAAIVEAN